jgi:hypothetical protein
MSIFNNIYTIEPNQLRSTVETISNSINIHEIYVSIGGKINNNEMFMEHNNNALYQIAPSYFQNKEGSSIVIVLDTFTNYEFQYCSDVIGNKYNIKTNIILCNTFCNKLFLTEFIPYIIQLATSFNCNTNSVVICNYIKFKYEGNLVEQNSLTQIPSTIYSLLKNTEYIDSFYEWFGYNEHMYNYIYKYTYYKKYRGSYSALRLLYDTIKTIDIDNTYRLEVQNPGILNFWRYLYDITNPKFISLFDDLSEKGVIKLSKL